MADENKGKSISPTYVWTFSSILLENCDRVTTSITLHQDVIVSYYIIITAGAITQWNLTTEMQPHVRTNWLSAIRVMEQQRQIAILQSSHAAYIYWKRQTENSANSVSLLIMVNWTQPPEKSPWLTGSTQCPHISYILTQQVYPRIN